MVTAEHVSALITSLCGRLRQRLAASLGLYDDLPLPVSPRMAVVGKVARNALFELVGRAKSHPQRGEWRSANPAYVALAQLTEESGRPGLALGLRTETGEITFLDLDMSADKVEKNGGAHVGRDENLRLWRRLEDLIYLKVDSTMALPRKPIYPPEEVRL